MGVVALGAHRVRQLHLVVLEVLLWIHLRKGLGAGGEKTVTACAELEARWNGHFGKKLVIGDVLSQGSVAPLAAHGRVAALRLQVVLILMALAAGKVSLMDHCSLAVLENSVPSVPAILAPRFGNEKAAAQHQHHHDKCEQDRDPKNVLCMFE